MEPHQRELATEDRIISLLQRNEQSVIQWIYKHYAHNLFNIIYRIVKDETIAEDVFQETMVKIWHKGHLYDRDKGSLYTWLVSVCKHAAIDKTRSRAYIKARKTESGESVVYTGDSSNTTQGGQQEHLREMIRQLPENQRTIIDMAYFQGYTHEEISKKLTIPLGTVKTRIRLAIKQLRKVIQ